MPDDPESVRSLRRKAEQLLSEAPEKLALMPELDLHKLVHELSVYQIELEMQNEELRKSQEQLEDSRSEYADLYDFAPVGYLTFDGKGLVTRANLTACSLLGIERSHLLKKPFALFIHPDSEDLFYVHRQKALEATTPKACQLVLKRKNGTFFDAQLESVPIQLNGQLALNSILTDITERTWIAREQKTEREQHTRLLGAEIEDLHILHEVSTKYLAGGDTQPLFQEIVEAAIAITRADKGSMQIQDPFSGKLKIIARKGFSTRFVEFFDSVGEGEAACGTAMKRKQRVIVEDVSKSSIFSEAALNVLLQEGVHAVQSTPLITRVGQLVGMISTHFDKIHPFNEREFRILDILARQAADILERNRIEEKEHCLELQLRQAQKMEALGTLTGGVAHDFNNILAAIIGFTELVADHVPQESREAHHLKRVMESSLRGRDLVRQMLTYSRKAVQEKKPLRLSDIVKETVKLIRATTPTTISVKVNALTDSELILADPTQIQQVILNLSTNAVYAMREKGGTLDIQLSDHSVSPSNGDPDGVKPGLYVKLTVRDTGTGISPDIIDKMFDPFFTTKKLGEGTGLGLSVIQGIVKQHNGYITVESEPGAGSIFAVYFPKVPGELQPDAVSDDAVPTGSERILFIDDEEALVEMGEDILAELGYEVTSRMNGKEALSLFTLDPSRFDLVITDQTMPEMTGIELAKQILALRSEMPIIMCTGFSYLVDADKAKAAGIKAFAMKPLTKREIAKTIRKVLDGHNGF